LAFHSGREADHSPPSNAEVKEWVELYLPSPIHLHGVVLRGSTYYSYVSALNLGRISFCLPWRPWWLCSVSHKNSGITSKMLKHHAMKA
jgi:hypothetical protein